jgi:hypothetical protein
MNTLMREALNSYLERIKSVFPTFQRFGVGSDAFDADELDYKWELIRLFQSTVAGRLVAAHTTRSMPDDVADSLIKMFAAPSHGSRQNLVDWRYTEAIEKRLTAAGKTQFATLAAKLLYGSDDTESRVDDFVHDLWLLLDGAGQKIDSWPAATRSITSYLLMLSNPSDHVILKTREFQRAFRAFLGEPLPDGPLTGLDYKGIQRFVFDLRDTLADAGLEPRDLIDVQSFIWVGDPEYKPGLGNTAAGQRRASTGNLGGAIATADSSAAVWQSDLVTDLLDLERRIPDRTERQTIIMARVGQGLFRANVIALWGLGETCALTGISAPALLTASHIKPWRDSTDEQRLDGVNGIMLAAHVDRLFDRHLLSFREDRGVFRCVIHPSVRREAEKLQLTEKLSIRSTTNLRMAEHNRFSAYMVEHLKQFSSR